MHFINGLYKEIKIRGFLEDLQKLDSVESRIKKLNEIVIHINISKDDLSFYTLDEQLYLFYLIQNYGVPMGLCPYYYIFFSNKNQRFHYLCKKNSKRGRIVYCRGNLKKCKYKS